MKLGEPHTALPSIRWLMGPERLPCAVLKHQHSVVALAQIIRQFCAVAPADHVRLSGQDEGLDRLVGGVRGHGTNHCEHASQHKRDQSSSV